jgi:hypothetical protein
MMAIGIHESGSLQPSVGHSSAARGRRGLRQVLGAAIKTLCYPIVRRNRRLVWEVALSKEQQRARWEDGERLLILGPENLDAALTPELLAFLGGEPARRELDGVRQGDRLFVVTHGTRLLSCSYIFFDTTAETRRQLRILGENRPVPVIGLSYTAPEARGRGLYRRILTEMFWWLGNVGFKRAICEVDPENAPSNKASAASGMKVCRELVDWRIANCVLVQRAATPLGRTWRLAGLR